MTTHQTRQPKYANSAAGERTGLLRMVLKLDAVATGAVGALLLVASSVLDGILGLPIALLVPVGIFLLVYAVAIMIVATRPTVSRNLALVAVVINAVWAVDSVLLIAFGWFPMTASGVAFVLFQASVVAMFAAVQMYALRKSS